MGEGGSDTQYSLVAQQEGTRIVGGSVDPPRWGSSV